MREAVSSDDVLLLAPTENDSAVAAAVLTEAGIAALPFTNLARLCERLKQECGAIVLAEEALYSDALVQLQELLGNQEPWSDIPVIVISSPGASNIDKIFSMTGNISLLERPFSRLTLIQSVSVALRSRQRQYLVRNLLLQQQHETQKRDEFFATLSHELRTPLNVILGWIEILRTNNFDLPAQQHALEILERNAHVQKGLIDDLLDVSRIVTGKLKFDPQMISLGKLIQSEIDAFTPRARMKNISLKLKMIAGDLPVMGDDSRLSQVISNLLTNAIKFTDEGGEIDVSVEQNKDNFVLKVQDNGQGVDPEFLPYMFDRLKQEDMSTTRTHGGLGLGLAIASHIVSEHQGRIFADSKGRSHGTCITVTLPIFKGAVRVPIVESIPHFPEASLKGVRVLVVDDSPDILELVKLWLGKADAEVKLASSAKEALSVLENYRPDVILSDIGMPETDGYQFIHALRALPKEETNQIPAVALTAYARDEERAKALAAGFQLHISKPISKQQLISAVAALVGQPRHAQYS